MTVEELKPGMKIFYRKGKYIYRGRHLQNRNLGYAEHEKTGVSKLITIKKVQLRDEIKVN